MEQNKEEAVQKSQVELLAEFCQAQPVVLGMRESLEKFIDEAHPDDVVEVRAFLTRLVLTSFLEKTALEQSMALSTLEATIVGYGHATMAAHGIYVKSDTNVKGMQRGEEAHQAWIQVATSSIVGAVDKKLIDGNGLKALAVKAQMQTQAESHTDKVMASVLLAALAEVTRILKARMEDTDADSV